MQSTYTKEHHINIRNDRIIIEELAKDDEHDIRNPIVSHSTEKRIHKLNKTSFEQKPTPHLRNKVR